MLKLEQHRSRIGLLKHRQQRIITEKQTLKQTINFKRTLIETFRKGLAELSELGRIRSDFMRERTALEFEQNLLHSQRENEIQRIADLERELRQVSDEIPASRMLNDESKIIENSLRILRDRIAEQRKIGSEIEFRACRIQNESLAFDHLIHEAREKMLRKERRQLDVIHELEHANAMLRNQIAAMANHNGLMSPSLNLLESFAQDMDHTFETTFCSCKYGNCAVLRERIRTLTSRIKFQQTALIAKKRAVRCKDSDIAMLIAETRKKYLLSDSGEFRSSLRLRVRRQELQTGIECLNQTAKLFQNGLELSLEPVSRGLWNSQLESVLSSVADRIILQSVYSLLGL
jgi:hypothetical protein